MKRIILFMIMLTVLLASPVSALELSNVNVKLASGTKYVSFVQFHPSEHFMLRPAFAEGGIGSTSSLAEMAEKHQAVAAINGTFFNAYDPEDLHPMGAIMIDREYAHIRGGAIVMGITASGGLQFTNNNYLRIEGTINGAQDRTWHASFINHMFTSPSETIIFTTDYRDREIASPGARFVIVQSHTVTGIAQDTAQIPDDGFVIAYGANVAKLADRFEIGDQVDYRIASSEVTEAAQHLISVGPKLITDGQADVDMARDGFHDPKMTTQSAGRSFIGSKADGTIVFGTVSNVTIPELAEVMLQLGLSDAMNLDGGASSGLYYDGRLVQSPGRLLSNSLIVVPQSRTPRIQVNGQEYFASGSPFMHEQGVMVSADTLTALGVSLTWDEQSQTLTAERADDHVQFTVNSNTATVNDQSVALSVSPLIRDDKVYIPLRFAAEAFGATVTWDAQQYLVEISIDRLEPEPNTELSD